MEIWRAKLSAGNPELAWDLFIERYSRLIHAVIRRSIDDEEDASDVFSEVCSDLSSNDLALLARHIDSGKARLSTWLVTVVHNRTIDWLRHRDGRRRVPAPPGLTGMQQQIFERIVVERRSHVEAYELIKQRVSGELSFGSFMNEVAATYQILEKQSGKSVTQYFPGPPVALGQAEPQPYEAVVLSEAWQKLDSALSKLQEDERLAIQLFVVDELSAASVARIVGWPNAKAVYNRVHRALAGLRPELERLGLDPRVD